MSSPHREVDPGVMSASAVTAALPLAACLIAADDAVLAWNSRAETLFGASAGDAVGRPFRDLEVSFRIAGLRAAVERVKAGGPAESLTAVVPPNASAGITVALSVAASWRCTADAWRSGARAAVTAPRSRCGCPWSGTSPWGAG